MLNLLSILVRRDGFRIDVAGTGDDALEKLKRPHDALILIRLRISMRPQQMSQDFVGGPIGWRLSG